MWSSNRSRRISARGPAPRQTRPRCEVLEGRALLATFHVADVVGLQAAVAAVNANPSESAAIKLAAGRYDLTSELLVLNASRLTIQGDPSGNVVVDNPTHSDRIFEFGGGDVTVDGLVITGGASDRGGGIDAEGSLGGSLLDVENCTIFGNTGAADGGGLFIANVSTTVDRCSIFGNTNTVNNPYHGASHGGGIYFDGGDPVYPQTLTIKGSTVCGNTAGFSGGGIFADGPTTIDTSTISGNVSGNRAGGILSGSSLTVKGSTVTGNSAANYGGGIVADILVTVKDSTVTGNSAANYGGGIYAANATLDVENSTISGNSAASGGGIYAVNSTAEIDNSTLNDPVGGGIVNVGSTIHLKNTLVDGVLYRDQYYQ